MTVSRFQSLHPELLCPIFDYIISDSATTSSRSDVSAEDPYHVAIGYDRPPIDHALLNASPIFRQYLESYILNTTTFTYRSATAALESCLKWPYRKSAGHELRDWLHTLSPVQRGMVRKLKLEMHASELLYLFAPPAAAKLLGLPHKRPAWEEVLDLLKTMQLSILEIVVLARCCPRPCKAGEKTSTGYHAARLNADGSMPLHWTVDWRWVVKSLVSSISDRLPEKGLKIAGLESRSAMQGDSSSSNVDAGEVKRIDGCTWNSLESSTQAWHRCDMLTNSDGVRAVGWAEAGHKEYEKWYWVPLKIRAK